MEQEKVTISLEEKVEKVKDLRPIDDVFFEVLADDIPFCQEMLRILLEDENLVVKDVIVQSSQRNLYGRSVRLDALCILGNGKKCYVEVQRSDNDDHVRRVRFNASSIAVKDSQKNEKFEQIEDIIVVYISQFDIFKANHVLYHVDSTIRETGHRIDDGLYRVFVNTEVKDGTTISEYMDCFLKKEVNNSKFPEFTDRMNVLKHEERGLDAVCEVMERYEQKAAEKAIARSNVDSIKYMITTFGATEKQILGNKNYSKKEYNTALKELADEGKTL